jgi:DME family drug/metabolite transporter
VARFEKGALLILAAAVLWGTTGTAQFFAPASAASISIGAVRLVIGGVALLVFAGAQGLLPQIPLLPVLPWVLSAAAMAAYQVVFFEGLRRTGVTAGTIVTIGSAPVFAGILSAVALRRLPDLRWFVATTLAIIGCVLIVPSGGEVQVQSVGVALALTAGASYALYAFFTSRMLARGVASDLAAAATFGLGALMLTPLLFTTDLRWLATTNRLLAALELGIFATTAAYILFTRGLRTTPLSNAVTLTLAEPIVASMLGVFIVGERLSTAGWLGVGLVFAALLLLTIRPQHAPASVEATA